MCLRRESGEPHDLHSDAAIRQPGRPGTVPGSGRRSLGTGFTYYVDAQLIKTTAAANVGPRMPISRRCSVTFCASTPKRATAVRHMAMIANASSNEAGPHTGLNSRSLTC